MSGASREGFNVFNRKCWPHFRRRGSSGIPWNLVFYDSTQWVARWRCRLIRGHVGSVYNTAYCARCDTRRPHALDAGNVASWAAE